MGNYKITLRDDLTEPQKHDELLVWDNWDKWCQDHEAPFVSKWCGESSQERASRGDTFQGTVSWDEAREFMRHGWPETRKKLARISAVFAAQNVFQTQPAFQMDVAGAFPIPPLAAAGDPLNMVAPYPVETGNTPIVRLVVHAGFIAEYQAESVANYGAALLSYIDAMEQAGVRFELEALLNSRRAGSPSGCSTIRVKVKEADEPVEIDRLGYVFCNASFFRRHGFRVKEQWCKYNHGSGYGSSCTPPRQNIEEDQTYLGGVMMFPAHAPELKSPAAILKAIDDYVRTALADNGRTIPMLWSDPDSIKDAAVS